MRTEKQKVRDYFQRRGFHLSPVWFYCPLIPHHYKTDKGDNVLIGDVCVTMHEGVDTKPGELGCICFYYSGMFRRKRCRNKYQKDMLKMVEVYDTARQVIEAFKKWGNETHKTIQTWKEVL